MIFMSNLLSLLSLTEFTFKFLLEQAQEGFPQNFKSQ
jgi:hypothetical protein